MALPSLHICLGVYLKFFNVLEDQCQIIDVKISAKSCINCDDSEYSNFIEVQTKIRKVEYEIGDCQEKINLVHDALSANILRSPENEEEICKIYNPRIEFLNKKLKEKVVLQKLYFLFIINTIYNFSIIIQLVTLETLKKSNNIEIVTPCVKHLDEKLQELGVQRQAYHGKTFIGNDVHKMLKVGFLKNY